MRLLLFAFEYFFLLKQTGLYHDFQERQFALFLLGTVLTGLGIAIYVGAHVGAGPRDGLMIAFHQRFGWPVWRARIAIEAIGFTGGLILRGPVGLGSIIWTLVIGTSAGFWFKVLHLTPDFIERGSLVID